MNRKIAVSLGDRSYDVWIEPGCLNRIGNRVSRLTAASRALIITDQRVAKLYGPVVKKSLADAGFKVDLLPLDLREATKNMQSVTKLYQRLLGLSVDRTCALLALGGGVVGDLTGFAAATYLRGLAFFQVPTTLLAQVDASVGGKVGVNFGGIKNLIGAFYQPQAVFVDPRVLMTLPKREMMSGMAEVIKYGVIMDPKLLKILEGKWDFLTGNLPGLSEIITRCVVAKAKVVKGDEREAGNRAILNFGHTLGHAIELESKGKVLHGEAVALGMAFATSLSFQQGRCSKEAAERVINMVCKIPVSLRLQDLRFANLWRRMGQDKKRSSGRLRMVMLEDIGKVSLRAVDPSAIKKVFQNSQFWWRKKYEKRVH